MRTTMPKLRKTIRKVIQESVWAKYDAKIKKAKQYIVDDQGLYYTLRQQGHPFSVAHYSLEPVSTKDHIMDLMDQESYLQGYKVVGDIANYKPGYVTYLLRDVTTDNYDYGVLYVNRNSNSGLMASGFGSSFDMLKDIVEYIHRGPSGDPQLDQYITQV